MSWDDVSPRILQSDRSRQHALPLIGAARKSMMPHTPAGLPQARLPRVFARFGSSSCSPLFTSPRRRAARFPQSCGTRSAQATATSAWGTTSSNRGSHPACCTGHAGSIGTCAASPGMAWSHTATCTKTVPACATTRSCAIRSCNVTSEYQYLVLRDNLTTPFAAWIESDRANNRMTRKLCGTADADAAIAMIRQRVGFVGLVERFDESLVMLRPWLGDPDLDIRYRAKNVMRDNRIKNHLLDDPGTREKLIAANRQDLRLYRYTVRTIYAGQVQRYGPALAEAVRQFTARNVRPVPTHASFPACCCARWSISRLPPAGLAPREAVVSLRSGSRAPSGVGRAAPEFPRIRPRLDRPRGFRRPGSGWPKHRGGGRRPERPCSCPSDASSPWRTDRPGHRRSSPATGRRYVPDADRAESAGPHAARRVRSSSRVKA